MGGRGPIAKVTLNATPRRRSMIVRTWRGWTRPDDAEDYAEYITGTGTGIVEYKATPGIQGAYLVRRPDGDRTEFLTISFWDNSESIVAFAGEDIDHNPSLNRRPPEHKDQPPHHKPPAPMRRGFWGVVASSHTTRTD